MSEVSSRVLDDWRCVEAWLEKNAPKILATLRPGATGQQIAAVEKVLGLEFPEALRSLFQRHDGQYHNKPGLFPGWKLLSLDSVEREWLAWNSLLSAGELFDEMQSDGRIRAVPWDASWIPFTSSGGGDNQCVDLNPGPSGVYGQVIKLDHQSEFLTWIAADVSSWFHDFATKLDRGVWTYRNGVGWENANGSALE